MLGVSLMAVLLLSAFNVMPALAQGPFDMPCPTCQGSGKITVTQTCQNCHGTGKVDPTVTLKSMSGWGGLSGLDWAAFVKGVFHNEEDVGVYGSATAKVTTLTATHYETSPRTFFPPHEDVPITLIIEEITFGEDWTYTIYLAEADDIDCPGCHGTGAVSVLSTCPKCGGSGYVTNPMAVGGVIVLVLALVAAAAAVAVKRRKVSGEVKP